MRDLGRYFLTAFIWIILGVMGIGATASSGVTVGSVILVALLLAFGTGITNILLGRGEAAPAVAETEMEKSKRAPVDKTQLLLDLMDEDEREAFKLALKEQVLGRSARLHDTYNDGEMDVQTLENLLEQRDYRQGG